MVSADRNTDSCSISVEELTEGQFRLAIEAAPTGMMMIDREGRIVLVNEELERLFGYARGELIGKSVEMLVPAALRGRHAGLRQEFSEEPKTRAMGAGRDLYGLRSDGSEVPVEIGLNPLQMGGADFVLSSVVDISERKRAQLERERLVGQLKSLNAELEQRVEARTADLTAVLHEREVLLQEVHHRVKNNLYVITSLMEMQARTLREGESRRSLQECEGRVHAIALIHEKLYLSKNYAAVPFSDYIRGLAKDVFQATGNAAASVNMSLAVDDVAISVEKAVPCGLILNELIINALKHGFPSGRSGTIRIELARLSTGLRLAVADDGIGLPSGLELGAATSLGLRLVTTLAKQLGAELSIRVEGGTRVELMFPEHR